MGLTGHVLGMGWVGNWLEMGWARRGVSMGGHWLAKSSPGHGMGSTWVRIGLNIGWPWDGLVAGWLGCPCALHGLPMNCVGRCLAMACATANGLVFSLASLALGWDGHGLCWPWGCLSTSCVGHGLT
jgi:hypothetical protein